MDNSLEALAGIASADAILAVSRATGALSLQVDKRDPRENQRRTGRCCHCQIYLAEHQPGEEQREERIGYSPLGDYLLPISAGSYFS